LESGAEGKNIKGAKIRGDTDSNNAELRGEGWQQTGSSYHGAV
jgi:hypothetical protein